VDNQILLTVFTGIVAVAFLLQSLALVGIYKSLRVMSERLDRLGTDLFKTTSVLTDEIGQILNSIRTVTERTQSIQESLAATSTIVQKRVANLDAFLQEATDIARLQILRVQDVVDNASAKVEDAFDSLHHSVLTPVHEVNAIIRGFRVALDVLLRRRMTPSASARQDEEMFI
jgi:hypothetical protein